MNDFSGTPRVAERHAQRPGRASRARRSAAAQWFGAASPDRMVVV